MHYFWKLGCNDADAKMSQHSLVMRTFILFLKDFVCRGQLPRGLRLSWLSARILEREGPDGTFCLRGGFNDGKMNAHLKIQNASCIRNKDPEFCSIGSLSCMFFMIYQSRGKPFPSFKMRKDWYNEVLFPAMRGPNSLPADTIDRYIRAALTALSIESDKVEHIGRLFSAIYLNEEGTPQSEINRQGLWAKDAMNCSYLEGEPAYRAQRVLAGFLQDRSSVFWPRATIVPSERLQRKVFPFLEKAIEEYNDSGDQQCKSGIGLLTLFRCLRVVFLQDTAILIEKVYEYCIIHSLNTLSMRCLNTRYSVTLS